MASEPGRVIGKAEAARMLADHIYADVLRQLARVMAADIEGERSPALQMRGWVIDLEARADALILITLSLAQQAGYSPDGLRAWAAANEPRRQIGWRP